ncbi:MAG: two-component regulator propeller domain-containing protein [Microscillaceae bacterium]|nr:two-component regulator propeller domain-containing protein [Microscillaceae bacterium]
MSFFQAEVSIAQDSGKPFLQNYTPKEYQADPQNWSIVQDNRGVMYFANDQGVLEYDGKKWQLIPTGNNSAVRSLSKNQVGIVFVGGSGEFGYLAPDRQGQMKYFSLKHKLADKDKDFEDVWTTHATSEAVFFHTDRILFRYDLKKKSIKTWYAQAESFFFLSYYVHQKLYLLDRKNGLMVLENDKIQLVAGGERFKEKNIYILLPFDRQKILLGTREEGLFTYNPKAPADQAFIPFKTEADTLIKEGQLYSGTVLPHGHFALCTRNRGLIVINKQGKLSSLINAEDGLLDENVRYALLNRENQLWLALDNGISKVGLLSPIRFWDAELGIQGTINDITRHQDKLYVATSLGVFYSDGNKFSPVNNLSSECWSLLNFSSPEKPEQKHLLVATHDGIFEILDNQIKTVKITNPYTVLSLYQSRFDADVLYAGLKGGLMRFRYIQGTWLNEGLVRNIEEEIYSIAEDEDKNLWLGTFINGVLSVTFSPQGNPLAIQRYDTKHGLPSLRDIRVYYFNQKLLFATQKGLYLFDPKQEKFSANDLLGRQFADGSRGLYRLALDANHSIWAADVSNHAHPIGVALQDSENSYHWTDVPLRRLPDFSKPVIYPDQNGIVWIGGSEGLYRYDSDQNHYAFQKLKYYNLIRKVTLNEDSLVFLGSHFKLTHTSNIPQVSFQQATELIPVFKFDPRFTLEFEYTSTFFDPEFANQYSHYLEVKNQSWLEWFFQGRSEKEWSHWSSDTKTQYTNLSEGNYIFYVKSRNIYGKEGLTASYQFKILPPWYRTIYAYLAYLVLLTVFILLTIRINTARLRRQKEILEGIVEERTKEIRLQNAELEQQREEILVQSEHLKEANNEITKQKVDIERKNEDITASINYASRIQDAMLPRMAEIKQAFPDSYILYKPRDIVSGDFYWYTETAMEPRYNKNPAIRGIPSVFDGFNMGKKIIAAVDCTGHGVPGAFMSMVGDAYLNQIIVLEGITQPQLILKELDNQVKRALKQDQTENLDGMDMTVCVVNPNNLTLEFAGAKNPLIYIQDGEIHHIRGDRYGIGGFQMDASEKVFARHVISIEKPTWVYTFSDGLQDQFGGTKGRKFMIKTMKKIFLDNYQKPMNEQKEILEDALYHWMQGYDQIDDILVIGLYLDPEFLKKD